MQRENILESDPPTVESPAPKPRSHKVNLMIWAHAVAFLLGLVALVWLTYKYREPVLESLARVGWGFALIAGLNITRHLLRAFSMYLAIAPEHRNFKYRSAIAARFGGEAVTFFTFTGPFLGDATKAVLLRRNVSLTHGTSAVIIDNILYYASVILVILAGVGALVMAYGSGGSTVNNILLAVVILLVVLFVGLVLAMIFRVTPITHAIDFLAGRNLVPGFIFRKRQDILNVENNVFRFYHERRVDFFKLFAISMSVHVVSVTEVYFALKYLGFEPLVQTAFIIESLTKVINVIFGFVPGTIGVYEGGTGVILLTLGQATETGIALGLVRHGAIFISTFIGVLILLWRTLQSGARQLSKHRD